LKLLLIELHFLPSIEYFCALQSFDEVIFEKHEHFVKQSYRNRCYINTANGKELVTIPLTQKHGKVSIKDIRIDYSKKWQNHHWRTIESAYRNSPYFEHYADEIQKAIFNNYSFLFDLNRHLLSFCLKSLKWDLKCSESVSYVPIPQNGIVDYRSLINTKKSHFERPFFESISYYQIFGNRFVENLSVIDLLFCEGPQSYHIISRSRKDKLNK
jgi:hypothetical protein